MSHNLHIDSTGEAALYLLKEKAWHGLGQVVSEAKTSKEVIEIAHLDWQVLKTPNLANINGQYVETGSMSTYRSDTGVILGNRMTDRYEVMQNSEAFEYMDSLVACDSDIQYETAGALGQGEKTFVTAKLPKYLRIAGSDDIIENYIVVINSHDSSVPLMVAFTPIRIVCNNTLNAAMKEISNKVVIRHTKSLKSKLEEGRRLIGLATTYTDQMNQVLNQLAKTRISDTLAKDIIDKVFMTPAELTAPELSTRKSNIMGEIYSAIETAPGQDLHRGTALHVYNGITSYFQNVKSYKNDSRKMQGIMIGGHELDRVQMCFDKLVSLV